MVRGDTFPLAPNPSNIHAPEKFDVGGEVALAMRAAYARHPLGLVPEERLLEAPPLLASPGEHSSEVNSSSGVNSSSEVNTQLVVLK